METILQTINEYIYPEYVVAVVLITALVRSMFKGIDYAVHPKWITLAVAVIMAIVGYAFKAMMNEPYQVFKVITSFGLACLGYDYFWKVIKDKLNRNGAGK